jgi:hypothetical protein
MFKYHFIFINDDVNDLSIYFLSFEAVRKKFYMEYFNMFYRVFLFNILLNLK